MAKRTFLDFEQPIAELETKIDELRYVQTESAVDISEEIEQLGKKSQQLTKDIYSQLTPWQITKIARHPERPYTMDYINEIFTDFVEMHGDRNFADDQSILGGLARFNGNACMVIGHQKGRDTKERALRNFGMSRPEGYRKALRLMKTAEKFRLPVFTFVDTPGAYPGIGAEVQFDGAALLGVDRQVAGQRRDRRRIVDRVDRKARRVAIGREGGGAAIGRGAAEAAVAAARAVPRAEGDRAGKRPIEVRVGLDSREIELMQDAGAL